MLPREGLYRLTKHPPQKESFMSTFFFELENGIDKKEKAKEMQLREVELIEEFTGKPIRNIINDYTLPERIRMNAYLDYVKCM